MELFNLKGLLFITVLFVFTLTNAQTVVGTVSETNGPLPGATVLVKGTQNGTQTDFDGKYRLDNVDASDIIVFSYVGFKPIEIEVGGQNEINVTLEEDAASLDEVVVTGYGTQLKKNVTGSVSTVDAEDLTAIPASTFAQQLQGRAAGVGIVNDATPGGEATVRIRGFGTLGNNNPLYIIDGVPSRSQANLNPNDIETLQVLKDASAASIYGARAANGVIIITTKKGKLGKPVFSYDTYTGVLSPSEKVDVLNARELGAYLYRADLYAGKEPSHGQYQYGLNGEITIPDFVFPSGAFEGDEGTDPSLYSLQEGNIYAITRAADTDWWEEVTRASIRTNHQISASGATENARYAFTLNYFEDNGVVKFVGYNRASIRANTEYKFLDKKFTIGENFTVSFDNRKGGFGNNQEQNAVSGSYKHHPLLPVYDIAGNFAGSRGQNLGNNSNPVATLSRQQDNRFYRLRTLGNVFASYNFTDALKLRTQFGLDASSRRGRFLNRSNPEYVEGSFINSSVADSNYEYEWQWNTVLTYKKSFNDVHNFEVYAGVEAIQGFGEFFNASRQGFPFEDTDIIRYLNLGDISTAANSGGAFRDFTLFSEFGRLTYDYDTKYLAEVTLRHDSSSRFLGEQQDDYFPAFSLGWRVSEEAFMESVDWVNELKLRYGYGQTGNSEVGDYNGYTTYDTGVFGSGYPIGGDISNVPIGYGAGQFGNQNAKWETTTSNNLGLDLLLFDNKFGFNLDVFRNITSDLLLPRPLDFGVGDAAPPSFNVGQITNEGFDLNMSWNDAKGDFGYGVTVNLSSYKNNVDNLGEETSRIFGNSSRAGQVTITEVGQPISAFYGFKIDGIFQTQEEADNHPAYEDYNAPGKFRVVDVNGDGVINSDDRTVIGSPHPDFTYGLNFDFSYKNLALNIFFTGSEGNDVYNYVRYFADFNTFQGNRSSRALYDAWQPVDFNLPRSEWTAINPNAGTPIMDANDQISSRPSTYFIEDGSYLRLRNIQLTFNFPKQLLDNLGLRSAQVYAQGQNLFTITDYSGLNPEIQDDDNDTIGFDGGYMPVARTFTVGLRFSLD